MNPFLASLLRLGPRAEAGSGRVALEDIESRLRSLAGGAQEAVAETKGNALLGGALGAVGLLAAVYLLGRRRGRRRSTVLEIRRV